MTLLSSPGSAGPAQPGARRFDRGAQTVLALSLLLIALNLTLLVLPVTLPSDGWAYSELAWRPGQAEWVALQPLTSAPSPLQPGDVLLAIDGQPMTERLNDAFRVAPQRPAGWYAGGSAHYEILRDGQPLALEVPLRRPTLLEVARILQPHDEEVALYGILPITFVITLVVFWLRPQLLAARVLLLFGSAVASGFLQAPLTPGWLMFPGVVLFPYLLSSWQFALLPALLHLLQIFPVVKWPLRQRPRPWLILLYGATQAAIWLVWLFYWGQARPAIAAYYAIVAVNALCILLGLVASLAHSWLAVRGPTARAQLAWMTFGLAVGFGGTSLFWLIGTYVVPLSTPWAWAAQWLLLALPAGLAIAILRYRLFDIDVVINRALVYGSLTALLLLAYFGAVVVLQSVLRFFTGAAQSQLVTVLSTLAIAALFTPLRARLQVLIDRRFYRRKYDAARILGAFSATLRDEVELDRLSAKLVAAVDDTLQPEHAALWLRRPAGSGR